MKWPCNGVFVHQINKKCKKKKNQWQKIRHIKYEVLLLSYGKLTI